MKNGADVGYPIILVHGMFGWGENEGINKKLPYWGGTTGSLTDYIRAEGGDCYAASVGPMSSAWDQACELYAQLKGTRVDYGKVHSQRFGHKRYGRTYSKPLFDGWSEEKKVHLVGHSFGGNTVRMLVHLLTYGAPEEACECDGETSELFLGGQEKLVCSVAAICSPLNGTDAYETARRFKILGPLKFFCYNYAGILSRTRLQGKAVDFHLEQFGVNDTPGKTDKDRFVSSVRTLFETKDCIEYDMSEKGTAEINKIIRISPSVYYFSYPYNCIDKDKDEHIRPVNIDFPFLKLTSNLMIKNNNKAGRENIGNDGLVDILSAMHPVAEPFEIFKSDTLIKTGVWNVMPLKKGDHGTPIGLLSDKEETHKFYDELLFVLTCAEKNDRIVLSE